MVYHFEARTAGKSVEWLRYGKNGLQNHGSVFPGARCFPLFKRVHNSSGTTQPPIGYELWALSRERLKRQEWEPDHFLPSSAAFQNGWSYTSIPPSMFS